MIWHPHILSPDTNGLALSNKALRAVMLMGWLPAVLDQGRVAAARLHIPTNGYDTGSSVILQPTALSCLLIHLQGRLCTTYWLVCF